MSYPPVVVTRNTRTVNKVKRYQQALDEYVNRVEGVASDKCTTLGCDKEVTHYRHHCNHHGRSETPFSIDTSLIPNAGNGLFTNKPLRKHQLVGIYGGEVMREIDLRERYGDLSTMVYVYEISPREAFIKDPGLILSIDGRDPKLSGIVRFINDARDDEINNVEWFSYKHPNPQYSDLEITGIRTIRQLPAGAELYLSYGDKYQFDHDEEDEEQEEEEEQEEVSEDSDDDIDEDIDEMSNSQDEHEESDEENEECMVDFE